jgi:hypothetical protein
MRSTLIFCLLRVRYVWRDYKQRKLTRDLISPLHPLYGLELTRRVLESLHVTPISLLRPVPGSTELQPAGRSAVGTG